MGLATGRYPALGSLQARTTFRLSTEMSYLRIPARINTHAHMQTIPITCKTLIVYITKPMNILLECYLLFPLSFLYFHIP